MAWSASLGRALLGALLCALGAAAWAHEDDKGAGAGAAGAQDARIRLVDAELVDQQGRPRRLVSDVIDGRVVILTTFYTSCTTVCPVSTAIINQVRSRLGAAADAQLRVVALSVDPTTDTPRRMREYAEKFKVSGDWVFLTGELIKMQKALDGLGVYTANFEDHPAMLIVGDASRDRWSRFYGFPGPEQVAAGVEALLEQRRMAAAEAPQPGARHSTTTE